MKTFGDSKDNTEDRGRIGRIERKIKEIVIDINLFWVN